MCWGMIFTITKMRRRKKNLIIIARFGNYYFDGMISPSLAEFGHPSINLLYDLIIHQTKMDHFFSIYYFFILKVFKIINFVLFFHFLRICQFYKFNKFKSLFSIFKYTVISNFPKYSVEMITDKRQRGGKMNYSELK